jgi:hypothetical protein
MRPVTYNAKETRTRMSEATTRASQRLLCCALAVACSLGLPLGQLVHASDDADLAREYRLKSAFLYNFTNFIQWPERAGNEQGAFRLCVVGSEPAHGVIRQALAGKSVGATPLDVVRVAPAASLEACALLFVGSTERAWLPELMRRTQGSGTLVVSEATDFGYDIAMINLVVVMNRVRLEVDREAAEREGLTMSSGLLSLATFVRKPSPETGIALPAEAPNPGSTAFPRAPVPARDDDGMHPPASPGPR